MTAPVWLVMAVRVPATTPVPVTAPVCDDVAVAVPVIAPGAAPETGNADRGVELSGPLPSTPYLTVRVSPPHNEDEAGRASTASRAGDTRAASASAGTEAAGLTARAADACGC